MVGIKGAEAYGVGVNPEPIVSEAALVGGEDRIHPENARKSG